MKCIVFLLAFTYVSNLFGQATNANWGKSKNLRDGIYLENLDVTIPWEYDFNDLPKLGNPRLIAFRKKHVDIVWDSVKIWNGKLARIAKRTPKKKISIVNPLLITFYNADFDTIKNFLEGYTGIKPVSHVSRKGRARSCGWKMPLFGISMHYHPKISGFVVYIYYIRKKND